MRNPWHGHPGHDLLRTDARAAHMRSPCLLAKALATCAALLLLAAAGCQDPNRLIEDLPSPTAGGRPAARYAQRPTSPPQQSPATPWWKWRTRPAPPPVRSTIGAEPGWVPRIGISSTWRCIVIHHSASDKDTPRSMDAWHRRRGWDELGYHFVIGNGVGYPDGAVFVGPRWTDQRIGAHCKTPGAYYNEHGIGICLTGNFENHRPTERQMQALARLVSFLQRQCGIPTSQILLHGRITGKTRCPGRYFSISDLLRRL
jgi:N-acetylmuramoyl-L-alanine amidase